MTDDPDAPGPTPPRHVRLFGLPVRAETIEEAAAAILSIVRNGKGPTIHVVLNAAKVSLAARQPSFRELLQKFDMIHADGASIVIASRLLGRPLPERVAGIDLMQELLLRAARNSFAVYFLGARQDVLDTFLSKVATRYPGLQIAGARNGYWTPDQELDVVRAIREAAADLLFVGVPTPKKESFLVRHRSALGVSFAMGVGGAFDVLAGLVRRAPKSWQDHGMEWAYRLLQEPRRMWKRYLVTNSHFAFLLCKELLHSRREEKPIDSGTRS